LAFETLELPTDNFTISKCIECNTTESRSFENLVFLKFQSRVHNFQSSTPTMVEDCEEDSPMINTSSGLQDITQLLALLSTQISAQNAKVSYEVVQTNTSFKQEVRLELDELRALVWDLKNSVPDTAPSSSVTQQHAPSSVQHVTQGSSLLSPVLPSPSSVTDQQTEMMMLFAHSMSKLSSVLSEKSEPKSEWPKFAGDQKKFRAWHLAIMAQLLLPPWVELYDATTNDIVDTTGNSNLNGKLYSKLLLALDGNALKNIVTASILEPMDYFYFESWCKLIGLGMYQKL